MTDAEVAQAMELAPELAGIRPIRYLGIGAAGQQLVARLALHLAGKLEQAREDLRKYGAHRPSCQLGWSQGVGKPLMGCTCGRDAALKGEPA